MQKQQENKVITIYDIAKEAGVSGASSTFILQILTLFLYIALSGSAVKV